MKFFPRFNTVYYRLIFSYIFMIVITTIFLGSTAYYYFSSNFNEEIIKINQTKIEYLRKFTDEKIFQKAEALYAELAINEMNNHDLQVLFDTNPPDLNTRIGDIFSYLQGIVNLKSDFVESIDVYFKDRQMIISTITGVKYINKADSKTWLDYSWIQASDSFSGPSTWLTAQDSSSGGLTYPYPYRMSFLGSYPYGDSNSRGTIAIHINRNAVHNLIRDTKQVETGPILLASGQGEILAFSKDTNSQADYQASIEAVMHAAGKEGHFMQNVGGVKSVVTYTTLESNGWKLLDITPVDEFYKKSDAVLRTLLIICSIAIAAGLIMSNLFTWNIYNPLKRIMESARNLFAEPSKGVRTDAENEYIVINRVIDHLSIKVQDLETTIQNNKPLIKTNLALGLLNRTIQDKKELNERMMLLQLSSVGSAFVCLMFEFDQNVTDQLDTENGQFLVYSFIDFIERHSDAGLMCIAIALSDYRVGVIVNAKSDSDRPIRSLIQEAAGFVHNNFMIDLAASFGNWVQSPFELHLSYKHAEAMLKYRYFLPGLRIFSYEHLYMREESAARISDSLLQRFDKNLKLHNLDEIKATLSDLCEQMANGPYSAEHCHKTLIDLVSLYHQYVKEINRSTQPILSPELIEEFKRIRQIEEFVHWLMHIVQATVQYLQRETANRSANLIEEVKQHIDEHIGDELSLNALADKVMLNPSYLSRLFKEETGINFVDYVNIQRINAAKDLIGKTDLNIEEISRMVGFNSSTYFIKKFKEATGATPKNYKYRSCNNRNN